MESPAPEVVAGSSRRQKRRAVPIIDSRFQWKYTLLITVLALGIMGLMGSFLYQAHLEHSALLSLDAHPELLEKVNEGDRVFLLYLILMVAAVGIAVATWGLILTHRISGPLFVLTRHLGTLAEGRYPEVRGLRKSDELGYFYTAFEVAIESMCKRDLERLERLDRARNKALRAQEENESGDLGDAIEALTQERNALAKLLGAATDREA